MRYDGQERRRYPRSRRALPTIADHAGPGVLNHIDNISASGILCHTVRPIPLMTRMSMALELPKPFDRRVECEGVVVRCDPDERGDDNFVVAILYTRMSEEDLAALEEYVVYDLLESIEDKA
jgi:hypothetical protein